MCSPGGSWVRGSLPKNLEASIKGGRVHRALGFGPVGVDTVLQDPYTVSMSKHLLFALISIREGSKVSPHEQSGPMTCGDESSMRPTVNR